MYFFIDTAKIEDIKKANEMGIISGVTTNPSLIAAAGGDFPENTITFWCIVSHQNINSIL